MYQKWSNNAFSTVASAINNSATTLSVATGTGDRFPAVSGGDDFFLLTLQNATNDIEIVKVTARTIGSDSLTIVRGQDGTAARSWSIGDIVELRVTAAGLNQMATQSDPETLTNKTISGASNTLTVRLANDVSGTLPVSSGGTGATSLTGVLKGNGTSAVTASNVNLSSEVTGTLPVASGGTGATTLTNGGYLKGAGTGAVTSQTGIPATDVTSGTLSTDRLPTVPVAKGGTGLTSAGTAGNVLTSDGTNWTSVALTAGNDDQAKTTVYTSPGTWTKPATVKRVRITVISGGGGGGGRTGPAGAANVAAGGGAGAAGVKIISAPSIPGPVTVTVGAGGTGGTSGVAPSGGTSSFGSFISATGGTGGGSVGNWTPGPGGAVTGADFGVSGGNGGAARSIPYGYSQVFMGGGGGAIFSPAKLRSYRPGNPSTLGFDSPTNAGGENIFGTFGSRGGNGELLGVAPSPVAGSAGAGYGAGGGGRGGNPGQTITGYNGTGGIIVVEEFY
jgi:hypothetical protein